MKWLLLFASVWAFIIGPLMIVFRKRLAKFFHGVERNRAQRMPFPNWVERFSTRTEDEFVEFYRNWGIVVVVIGTLMLILFFIAGNSIS
jgi:hypothetical protein